MLDFPFCYLSGHIQHTLIIPPSDLCLPAHLLIHHPLCCVFRHGSSTPLSSEFFLHLCDPYFRPPRSQVALWRGSRHLSAVCVCIALETERRTHFVGHRDTSFNITSKGYTRTDRGTPCGPNPCPAAPIIRYLLIIFCKQFFNFFLLETKLVT